MTEFYPRHLRAKAMALAIAVLVLALFAAAASATPDRWREAVLDIGTTGNLRFPDLVTYDRQTESWWQQFTGAGIVGEPAGSALTMLPVRIEPFGVFATFAFAFNAFRPGGTIHQ